MTTEELVQALEESKAETAACLEFLQNEMEWECFRIEMLYFDQPDKLSASERNAEKLKAYLKEKGHGIKLLQELYTLRRLLEISNEEVVVLLQKLHGTGGD